MRLKVVLLVFLLMACAAASPEETIEAYFTALREGDLFGSDSYLSPPLPAVELDEAEMELIESRKPLVVAYFGRLSYEIHEVTLEGDSAAVWMTLQHPDMLWVRNQVSLYELEDAMAPWFGGDPELTEDDIVAFLIELYQDEELPMRSSQLEVVMVYDDGWRILNDGRANRHFFAMLMAFPD